MHNKKMRITIGALAGAILLTSAPVDVLASKDITSEYFEGVSVCFTAGAHCAINETSVLIEESEEEPEVEENDVAEVAEAAEEAVLTGEDIVEFALQYVGNKYVYGGTSLTNGADCSGFVMRVYEAFGYQLPRSSYYQRSAGREVSAEEIQPGDIVCYSGHVAIYIGDGKIVHASNAKDGIKVSNDYRYRKVLSIRRILE